MSEIWQGLIGGLASVLRLLHDAVADVPLLDVAAWGWAIVLLTAAVRLVLLPLAVKQIRSMRAMQTLQPEIKKLQGKYKTDRTMMKTDPEKYRERKAAQQQEMMALYKEHGVNPAAGCLPLVAQMPVFFALFTLLRSDDYVAELGTARFYFTSLADSAIAAGIGGVLLILAMAATTYISQKQMMAHQPADAIQPQQRMMLYLMPVMLAFFSLNLPVGVLLYWATTNLWTMGQQYVMFRNVQSAGATPGSSGAGGGGSPAGNGGGGGKPSRGATPGSSQTGPSQTGSSKASSSRSGKSASGRANSARSARGRAAGGKGTGGKGTGGKPSGARQSK